MITIRFSSLGPLRGAILDLGAGAGRHALAAMHLGLDAVAVDISRSDLSRAAEDATTYGQSWRGSLATTVGDGRRLPFADGAFGAVICSEMFEHVPEVSLVVQEIRRVLADDGMLAVTVPSFFPELVNWIISREYHAAKGGHIRIFSRRSLLRLLEENGFRSVHLHRAHALHTPFWLLRSWVGVHKKTPLVQTYEAMLLREMMGESTLLTAAEHFMNPFVGKSIVVYLRKALSPDEVGP